ECEVEGGELGAARVEFEAVEVVAEDGVAGFGFGEVLFGHAESLEEGEGGGEEVAAAAAGVHDGDVFGGGGPAVKGAGGGSAVVEGTEVAFVGGEGGVGVAVGPPGAEGVVQEELHHVVLGEELGDGG